MKRAYPLFRPAIVVSQDDPEKTGRLQLQILPELKDISDDLPWADPFTTGTAGKSFRIPAAKTKVWCVIWNKYWTDVSYLPGILPDPDNPPFKDFMDNIASKIDKMEKPEYPGINLDTEEDGFITFHDVKGQQHGIYHPSGVYVLIAKNGDTTVRIVTKLEVATKDGSVSFAVSKDDKAIIVKAEKFTMDGKVEVKDASDAVALYKPLEEVLGELLDHMHVAPGGPTSPALKASKTPLSSMKANLSKIKSKSITTD